MKQLFAFAVGSSLGYLLYKSAQPTPQPTVTIRQSGPDLAGVLAYENYRARRTA